MALEVKTVTVELTGAELATLIDAARAHDQEAGRRATELYGDPDLRNPIRDTMKILGPKLEAAYDQYMVAAE